MLSEQEHLEEQLSSRPDTPFLFLRISCSGSSGLHLSNERSASLPLVHTEVLSRFLSEEFGSPPDAEASPGSMVAYGDLLDTK